MTLLERFAHYLRYRHQALYAVRALIADESKQALQLRARIL